MPYRTVLAVLALSCAAGGVHAAPSECPVPNPDLTPAPTLRINPSVVNAAANDKFGCHFVYAPAATPKQRLYVFLPASASWPGRYQKIMTQAANAGLHTIGLAYVNGGGRLQSTPIENVCVDSTTCFGDVRNAQYAGGTVSPNKITVSNADALLTRLTELINRLADTRSGEGWAAFRNADRSLRWDRVRIAGLSQGAGLAGYIAKKKKIVDQACLHSGPADWGSTTPAQWIIDDGSRTLPERIYGFHHIEDDVVKIGEIRVIWDEMGVPVGELNVDDVLDDPIPDFAAAHRLTTEAGTQAKAHTSTASDTSTPNVAGTTTPLFRPVWEYMCFR